MPKAQIIGRVAVKVLPDTSRFRREAQSELDRIENHLKVTVEPKINDAKFKSEALKAVQDLNKTLRSSNAYKVRFQAVFSKSSIRTAVAKAAKDMEQIAKHEKVEFDADVAATIAEVQGKLDRESLKIVEKELEDWREDISPLEVEVATSMLAGATSYVNARLRYLTRPRTVEIIPKINESAYAKVATALAALAGARVLNDMLDKIWQRLKRLDKSVPIIGTVAEAIAGLTAYTMTAASNMFALAQSLAQIGPAALALPGIFGGLAIGLGISIAALKDFNKVLPEVGDMLSELQNKISENFWAKAAEPIRHMIDTLFPLLSESAAKTATQLGTWFGNFATSLETILGPILQSMFDDLSKSISIASQYTDHFVGIIATLGQVGAGFLPRLAKWFGEISKSFDGWLREAAADGRLEGWINQGIFQLKELGRAVAEMGGIFAGLAEAAQKAGGSTLTMFADTLERVNNAVNSEGFQTVLTGALRAAHIGMENIAYRSGPATEAFFENLGKLVQTIFPIMGETVGIALDAILSALSQPEFNQGIKEMFLGIQTGVQGLAPAMAPAGKALGALAGIVGNLAANMGPVLGVALTTLSNILVNLSGPINALSDLLSAGLLTVIEAIAPHLENLGSILSDVFMNTLLPALKPIIATMTAWASAVLPMVIDAVGQIIVALTPLIELLGQLFEFIGPVLVPVLTFLASLLLDTVVTAVQGVVNVVMGFVGVLTGLYDTFVGLFVGLFTGEWDQFWNGIKDLAAGIWNLIKGAFQLFMSVGILGVGRKIFKAVKALFKNVWKDIWKAVKGFFDNIGGSFLGFMNDMKRTGTSVLQAIKNLFRSIWNDIKTLIRNVWHAITSNISGAISSVKSVVSGGFNTVKSIVSGAMSALRSAVKTAWNLVKAIFRGDIGEVLSILRGLGGKVKDVFKNAGKWLLDAGKKIINGLIDGIGSKIGAVKDKLKGLTKYVPDWKGPAEKDKTLLVNAGQLIIDGLIVGLESRYDAVRKSLGGLTSEIGGMEVEAPGVNARSNALTSHLAAVVSGSASGEGGQKVLNYYAAPNQSLDAEEDLFAASERTRMVGW